MRALLAPYETCSVDEVHSALIDFKVDELVITCKGALEIGLQERGIHCIPRYIQAGRTLEKVIRETTPDILLTSNPDTKWQLRIHQLSINS